MVGVEVIGVVLNTIPTRSATFFGNSNISKALKGNLASSYLTKLGGEKARSETSRQLLFSLDGTNSDELHGGLVSLMEEMDAAMDTARSLLKPRSGPSKVSKNVNVMLRSHKIAQIIDRISRLNDQLQMAAQILARAEVRGKSVNTSPETLLGDIATSLAELTGEHPAIITQRLRDKGKNIPVHRESTRKVSRKDSQGQSLQRLVASCNLLLRQLGKSESVFASSYNQFALWKHSVESESIYNALNSAAAVMEDVSWQDWNDMLFRSMLRVANVLIWWIEVNKSGHQLEQLLVPLKETAAAVNQASIAFPEGMNFGTDGLDIAGSPKETDRIALHSMELVIGNLCDCLPTMITFCRRYAVQGNDRSACKGEKTNIAS